MGCERVEGKREKGKGFLIPSSLGYPYPLSEARGDRFSRQDKGMCAHGHSHGHDHGPVDYGRAFAIGIALNVAYVAAEAVFGLGAHSLALVADAGHNLSDVLGLGLGWLAVVLAKRPPTPRHTYGLRIAYPEQAKEICSKGLIVGSCAQADIRLESNQVRNLPPCMPTMTCRWRAGMGSALHAALKGEVSSVAVVIKAACRQTVSLALEDAWCLLCR